MDFSAHATETSKEVLRGFTEPPCSDDDRKYVEALARSDDLHLNLKSAELSDHQVEGFLAVAYALRMDYTVFRRSLVDAQAAQKQVSDAAVALLKALERIGRHDFIRPELRYAHDFLGWAGISSAPRSGLDALVQLTSLIESLRRLATDERPTHTDFTGAAISRQKASAPHEFARACLFMMPPALQERLCPAISVVVNLAHPEGMSTQEVRRLMKDLTPKSA